MQQILFEIPTPWKPITVYGFGFMLFCAFLGCTWLAIRLARRHGVSKEAIWDLSTWLILTGVVGARLTFIIVNWGAFGNFWQIFAVWDGGLVFYGSIPGAALGYLAVYHTRLKAFGVTHWQMADVVAPGLALGLCLGRIGCLLNGCCFGNVACAGCASLSFPLSSPPRYEMVRRGHQTPAQFLTFPETRTVMKVEPGSAAAEAGLKPGDTIAQVGGKAVASGPDLEAQLVSEWPRGQRWLELGIQDDGNGVRQLASFAPGTIGLHPTQLYESISMALLLFFLLSYAPYKPRDGLLMVIFMFAYAVHRFLNEMLRTDTEPVAFDMTLSQNISVAVFLAALVVGILVWRYGRAPTVVTAPTISS